MYLKYHFAALWILFPGAAAKLAPPPDMPLPVCTLAFALCLIRVVLNVCWVQQNSLFLSPK